jgi:formate dehydrogenase subunit gamma
MTAGGTVQVRICGADACQSAGADDLIEDVERHCGIRIGATTADGRIRLTKALCLDDCELAPTAMIDTDFHGFMNGARLVKLIEEATSTP